MACRESRVHISENPYKQRAGRAAGRVSARNYTETTRIEPTVVGETARAKDSGR